MATVPDKSGNNPRVDVHIVSKLEQIIINTSK